MTILCQLHTIGFIPTLGVSTPEILYPPCKHCRDETPVPDYDDICDLLWQSRE